MPIERMAGASNSSSPDSPMRDRDAAERDGLAGGGDGALDGLADRPAAAQLLAEPADDEQRVVDGEREPEHRRDVEHEDAHLDLLGDDVDERQAARDGQAGDEQRHPGRDDRGEDEDQDDRGDRQRDELGLLEVLLGLLGRVLGDRPVAGQLVSCSRPAATMAARMSSTTSTDSSSVMSSSMTT